MTTPDLIGKCLIRSRTSSRPCSTRAPFPAGVPSVACGASLTPPGPRARSDRRGSREASAAAPRLEARRLLALVELMRASRAEMAALRGSEERRRLPLDLRETLDARAVG